MKYLYVVILALLLSMSSMAYAELHLQEVFNNLGYSTNVETDEVLGTVFFQRHDPYVSIVQQISSYQWYSALGWYTNESDGNWLVGGDYTGLPTATFLPEFDEAFGLNLWTNYATGNPNDYTWYSERDKNTDHADHVKIYRVRAANGLEAHSYLIAWEDLPNLGDADFQDMVVLLQGVDAITGSTTIPSRIIPEPATIVFFLSGIVGLMIVKEQRSKK